MKSNKVYSRVNITMDTDTLERINKYVVTTRLSRSAVICEAVNQYITTMESLPAFTEQVDELKSLLEELATKQIGDRKTPTV